MFYKKKYVFPLKLREINFLYRKILTSNLQSILLAKIRIALKDGFYHNICGLVFFGELTKSKYVR